MQQRGTYHGYEEFHKQTLQEQNTQIVGLASNLKQVPQAMREGVMNACNDMPGAKQSQQLLEKIKQQQQIEQSKTTSRRTGIKGMISKLVSNMRKKFSRSSKIPKAMTQARHNTQGKNSGL